MVLNSILNLERVTPFGCAWLKHKCQAKGNIWPYASSLVLIRIQTNCFLLSKGVYIINTFSQIEYFVQIQLHLKKVKHLKCYLKLKLRGYLEEEEKDNEFSLKIWLKIYSSRIAIKTASSALCSHTGQSIENPVRQQLQQSTPGPDRNIHIKDMPRPDKLLTCQSLHQ